MPVEPVKLMRRTCGFETSSSPIGTASPGPWVTMLSTPGGRPAASKISPQIRPPTIGEFSEGLSTTVLPSTSGAAMERAERISAAFQGAMAPTTPTGLRMPIANAPGMSEGRISPVGAYALPAAWRKSPGTKCIWNMPKPKLAPVSRASSPTISSMRLSRMSAALQEDALSHGRRRLRPGRERRGRGVDRGARVGGGAGGHAGHDVAGERIDVVERATVGGSHPLARDELARLEHLTGRRAHVVLLSCVPMRDTGLSNLPSLGCAALRPRRYPARRARR